MFYLYKKLKFKSEDILKCLICHNDFLIRKKKDSTREILKCSNLECSFNKLLPAKKYEIFLPFEGVKKQLEFFSLERRKANLNCIEYWMVKGYSEDESKNIISENQKAISLSNKKKRIGRTYKQLYDRGYSEEEAKLFIRKSSKLCIEYWINKGYTEEEGKKIISENQKKLSDKSKIKNPDFRFCNVKSKLFWSDKNLSEEEIIKIISNSQKTFSKEKCIEKYGKEEGIKRWQDRQEKWQTTLNNKSIEEKLLINSKKDNSSLKFLYKKYKDEEIANKKYEEIVKSKCNFLPYEASKASLKVFIPIINFLNIYGINNKDIFIGYQSYREYFIYDNENKKIRFYDFTIKSKKIIIEYHGNYWHMTKESKENDIYKKELAIKKGFKYLTILEETKIEENIEIVKEFLINILTKINEKDN